MSKLKARSLRNKTEVFARNEDGEFESIEVNSSGELKTNGIKSSDLTFNSSGELMVSGISGGGGGGSSYDGVYNRVFNETITGLNDSSQVFDIGNVKTIYGIFNMSTNIHTTAFIHIEASTGLVDDSYNWFTVMNAEFNGEPLVFDFSARYYKYTLTLTAPSNNIISQFSIVLREETVVEVSNFPLTDDGRILVDNGDVTFKSLESYTLEGSDLERVTIPFNKTINARVKITQLSNTPYNANQVGSLSSGIDDGIGSYVYSSIILPGQTNSEFTLTVGQTLEFNMSGEALRIQFLYLGTKSIELRVDIEEIPISSNPDMNFTNGALNVNVDSIQVATIPVESYVYTRLVNSSNTFDITSNYSSSNSSFRYVIPNGMKFVWRAVNFLIFDESFHLGDGVNLSNGIQLRYGENQITNFRFSSELQRFFKSTQESRGTDDDDRYFYEHIFDPPLVLEAGQNPNINVRDDVSSVSNWQWSLEGFLIEGDV